MPEQQTHLGFDASHSAPPAVIPELRDEIAQAWSLPLGERIQVRLRDSQCDTLTGTLELAAAPDFPWNPRAPLQLRVAGFAFSSRDIAQWVRL